MKKMYTRTIVREIKQSLGRFAAIIAIVALGVGFLVGILSSTPDMKASADQYYSKNVMSDFDIKGTMGLTEDDISALRQVSQTDKIMPAYVTDALMSSTDSELLTGRIYGLDLDSQTVNKLTLVKGRLPDASDECVIESPNASMAQLTVGDTLTLSKDNDNLQDTYTQRRFKIVGIVDSPYYFCSAKEPSSVGNGRVGAVLYTKEQAYKLETYTDLFVTIKAPAAAFSEEYDSQIEQITKEIEAVADTRSQARYQEIKDEAEKKINKAKRKLETEKEKTQRELRKAQQELEDGQKELAHGESQLNEAKAQLKTGKKQLKDAKKQLASGKSQLKAGRKKLNASKAKLDKGKDAVEQAKAAQSAGMTLSQEVLAQIESYEKGLAAWKQGTKKLDKEEKKLAKAQNQIRANEKKLIKAQKEITANEKKLDTARAQLKSGQADYEEGKKTADAEFTKAEKKIEKSQDKIDDIQEPEWYILDRNSNVSYARYQVDVEKVAAVATVFPVFFFLVAALVSLTTMTRMVEEERIQIGTLKALGYRRGTIMSKYLIYCGAATALGCLIGLAAGFQLLPTVIYKAYASQYDLPALTLQFHYPYAFISCGLEILCTLGATWIACSRTLKEKPANLMVPRAPKAGKRILLEKVTFIWKRLSFSYKATARNIFRYKKHLFMTIVGIAGCTALMVAGFGMRDSMSDIVKTQYTDLFQYDAHIELAEDKTDTNLQDFLSQKEHIKIASINGEVTGKKNKEKVSTTIYLPQDNQLFTQFVSLRSRTSGSAVPFQDQSAVMTEKMADVLKLSVGDTFTLTNADDNAAQFTLTGITENYVGCYLYMDPSLYTSKLGDFDYNGYLVKSGITSLAQQDQTAQSLQDGNYVSSIEFTSQSQESYESMLSSINVIVYILILCAGALAVVVLYNLTNININERSKELATLRVLGYYQNEVARYIFREIGLLSILGTAVGLLAGWALHHYVIVTAESVDMMMGRSVSPLSYLLAAVITLAFSALVDFLMTFKLRQIKMAESMKAVD